MRPLLIPTERAASTNGISRNDRTFDRITRATCGTNGIEIAMIVFSREGPKDAAITSAITRRGRACIISIIR